MVLLCGKFLPITPPDEHGSPYASPSAFAAWDSLGESEALDMKKESYWLEDWLLFEALKVKFGGKPWYEWPVEYRDRNPSALAEIIPMQLPKPDLWVAGKRLENMQNRRMSA